MPFLLFYCLSRTKKLNNLFCLLHITLNELMLRRASGTSVTVVNLRSRCSFIRRLHRSWTGSPNLKGAELQLVLCRYRRYSAEEKAFRRECSLLFLQGPVYTVWTRGFYRPFCLVLALVEFVLLIIA